MKKKGTIGIVATLGLGLCAYALSQQTTSQGREKESDSVFASGQEIVIVCPSKRKTASKRSMPKEKTQAEQIVIKITDEGFVTSHGDHFHYYSGRSHLMPSLVKS